jgi:alpha-1,3-rhamnosyl/mannosyltransferase
VPVVCSDRASLPEVAGEAALLVNPDDVESMSQGFLTALGDESEINRLVERAKVQANCFDWGCCVSDTIEIYRDLL